MRGAIRLWLHCPCNSSAYMGLLIVVQFGQTKIRDFRGKIGIKKNVASFNISVNNSDSRFLVKISKTPGDAQAYVVTRGPIKI